MMKRAAVLFVLFFFASAVSAVTEEKDGYVRVPGGVLAPAECVHGHFSGGNKVFDVASAPRCPRPIIASSGGVAHGSAWRAWAEYDAAVLGATLGEFTTDFVVPPQPKTAVGQIVYLWPGVEPSDTSAVIQPVLQWGRTPAGGGNYWAVASWYVSSSHGVHYSSLVKCNEGDTIRGVMTRYGNNTWNIVGSVLSSGENATLALAPVDSPKFTFLFEVLEAYNLGTYDCNRGAYPATPCVFKNIGVRDANGVDITPKWAPRTQDDSCGEHATIENGEVTIHYLKDGLL